MSLVFKWVRVGSGGALCGHRDSPFDGLEKLGLSDYSFIRGMARLGTACLGAARRGMGYGRARCRRALFLSAGALGISLEPLCFSLEGRCG